MIAVQQYVDLEGRNAFERWVRQVEINARLKIERAIEKLEDGNTGTLKGIGAGLFELRIDYGPGYRVYCAREGATLVILFGGGIKKRQQEDIAKARSLWQEYRSRNRTRS